MIRLRRRNLGRRRRGARRHLGDHRADLHDPRQQCGVGGGVRAVDTSSQHRHGHALDRQRSAMGGRVDAERGAGDDGPAAVGEPGTEVGSHRVAVGRAGAGAHHRHRPLGEPGEVGHAPDPQADRGGGMVVHTPWPPQVARTDDLGPDHPSSLQVGPGIGPVRIPLRPGAEDLGHPRVTADGEGERPDGAVLLDEAERPVVGRLGDPRPPGPRATLGPAHRGGHAATRTSGWRRASARPMSSPSGRSVPARSLSVHASRRQRS